MASYTDLKKKNTFKVTNKRRLKIAPCENCFRRLHLLPGTIFVKIRYQFSLVETFINSKLYFQFFLVHSANAAQADISPLTSHPRSLMQYDALVPLLKQFEIEEWAPSHNPALRAIKLLRISQDLQKRY